MPVRRRMRQSKSYDVSIQVQETRNPAYYPYYTCKGRIFLVNDSNSEVLLKIGNDTITLKPGESKDFGGSIPSFSIIKGDSIKIVIQPELYLNGTRVIP